ncbi:hypothetical protein AOLI_G00189940 [Acnodon oligacanthus]
MSQPLRRQRVSLHNGLSRDTPPKNTTQKLMGRSRQSRPALLPSTERVPGDERQPSWSPLTSIPPRFWVEFPFTLRSPALSARGDIGANIACDQNKDTTVVGRKPRGSVNPRWPGGHRVGEVDSCATPVPVSRLREDRMTRTTALSRKQGRRGREKLEETGRTEGADLMELWSHSVLPLLVLDFDQFTVVWVQSQPA